MVHYDLDVSGLLSFAPRGAGEILTTGGGTLRFSATTRYFGIALGAAGVAPNTLALTGGTARLLRMPIDLDLRGTLRRGRFEGIADVGLVVSILGLSGHGYIGDRSTTGVNAGIRLSAALRIWLGRVAPFVAAEALIDPMPFDLHAGNTLVGTTPQLWIGVLAGLAVRIH